MLLIVGTSCTKPEPHVFTQPIPTEENIYYFKDERTGICFARVTIKITEHPYTATSITAVDCDKVEKFLLK